MIPKIICNNAAGGQSILVAPFESLRYQKKRLANSGG
jgi:hypothetical protein